MRLVRNSSADRALDLLREWLAPNAGIDIVSPTFSLLAFAEIRDALERIDRCRLVLGERDLIATSLLGNDGDIAARERGQEELDRGAIRPHRLADDEARPALREILQDSRAPFAARGGLDLDAGGDLDPGVDPLLFGRHRAHRHDITFGWSGSSGHLWRG